MQQQLRVGLEAELTVDDLFGAIDRVHDVAPPEAKITFVTQSRDHGNQRDPDIRVTVVAVVALWEV